MTQINLKKIVCLNFLNLETKNSQLKIKNY